MGAELGGVDWSPWGRALAIGVWVLAAGCSDSSRGPAEIAADIPAEVVKIPDAVPDAAPEIDAGHTKDADVIGKVDTSPPAEIPACNYWKCAPLGAGCGLVASTDGTPCDDGDPCTSGDVCTGGVCQPTNDEGGPVDEPRALLPQTWEADTLEPIRMPNGCDVCVGRRAFRFQVGLENDAMRLNAIASDGEGGVVVVEGEARLRRLDAALNPVWSQPLSAATDGASGNASTWLEPAPGGGYIAAGERRVANQPARWVARYDAAGVRQWERTDVVGSSSWQVYDLLVGPSADIYLAGSCNFSQCLFARTADGALSWTSKLFDPELLLVGLQRTSSGRLLAGVVVRLFAQNWEVAGRPGIVEFDSDGHILGTRMLPMPLDGALMGGTYPAILALTEPERLLMVVNERRLDDVPDRRRVGVRVADLASEWCGVSSFWPPWNAANSTASEMQARHGVATSDGGMLLAGSMWLAVGGDPVSTASYPSLLKLDAWGNAEWWRLYTTGLDTDQLRGVVAEDDGTITAVGSGTATVQAGYEQRGYILRTDHWGRTCGVRLGLCADTPWTDCVDKNPCTVDWCDPDTGCANPPLPDGSICGIAKACQAGVCQ